MKTIKLLFPMATVVTAASIAVGSGATFTSISASPISSIAAGRPMLSNSKSGAAVFILGDAKPGDVVNGRLTIANAGTSPERFGLTEIASTNGFAGGNLQLVITNTTTGTVVYRGVFGGLADGARTDLGVVAAGAANDFTFRAALATTADNTQQGKTATAAFRWDAIQADDTVDR